MFSRISAETLECLANHVVPGAGNRFLKIVSEKQSAETIQFSKLFQTSNDRKHCLPGRTVLSTSQGPAAWPLRGSAPERQAGTLARCRRCCPTSRAENQETHRERPRKPTELGLRNYTRVRRAARLLPHDHFIRRVVFVAVPGSVGQHWRGHLGRGRLALSQSLGRARGRALAQQLKP